MARTSQFQWDDDEVCYVLDQHAELDFYSATSQSSSRHVASLGHIILIPSQPSMLSGEAANTNFMVVGLTRPWLEPTINRTHGEHANHYAPVVRQQRMLRTR